MDSKALRRGVVEECYLVCDIHTHWVSNKCFAALNIPDNERVVVLATEGSKVLLIMGEGKTLDKHLVQFQSVHHLQGVEVPNNDISLETHMSLLS